MAIIGTIMTIFMDGLAIIMLPIYTGNITSETIMNKISPATKSLYLSSISPLWLNPYKVLGIASAMAIGSLFYKKNKN